PAKRSGLRAHQYGPIGLISLVYIPTLQGFFERSLEVLDIHLASLRNTLPSDAEIIVWDNGSCPEVVQYLRQQLESKAIDYLFLSRFNLGKTGALNWLFPALPHPWIGYTDSDVYFMPGWWEATQQLFEAFPQAGMVSAQPGFFDVLRGESQMVQLVKKAGFQPVTIQAPLDEYTLYLQGLGKSRQNLTPPSLPVIQNGSVQAVLRATHMQFVMPRDVAQRVVPLPVRGALHRDDDRELHKRVEQLGRWQLSTLKSYVYHMGNTPWHPTPEAWASHAQPQNTATPAEDENLGFKRKVFRAAQRLIRSANPVQKRVERLYHLLFRLLYE
ncbi:MAG: glycosyltransferase family 2 protein, partial [Chloroflexi bacterium]|nr:glycosyltransferase family 2 protein [Chloroflexota bacterium]